MRTSAQRRATSSPRSPFCALALAVALAGGASCGGSSDGPRLRFGSTLTGDQAVPPASIGVEVTVRVRNGAPEGGTFLTPVWVGFHDGDFDLYDLGAPASLYFPGSNALEALAEDGTTGPLSGAFLDQRFGRVQATLAGEGGEIAPGETVEGRFVLNIDEPASRFFSYATMVIPSNDAFLANEAPRAHPVLDPNGFLAQSFPVDASEVLDAGTEVNDEAEASTAFLGQTVPGTGVPESGVVARHPGFAPPGSGGILDAPGFPAADFTAYEDPIADVTFLQGDVRGTDARGTGAFTLSGDETVLVYDVQVTGLTGEVTAAALRLGGRGETGPVLHDLLQDAVVSDDGVRFEGAWPLDTDDLAALRRGAVYVNVATAVNPAGEVRGQVR